MGKEEKALMKKQKRQLLVLCLLMVICAGAYLGLKAYNDAAKEKEQQETEKDTVTAIQVNSDDVTSFSWISH